MSGIYATNNMDGMQTDKGPDEDRLYWVQWQIGWGFFLDKQN